MWKVYVHPRCNSCKKALVFLDRHGVQYDSLQLTETAPSRQELLRMAELVGDHWKLFNTSGKRYRELELSQQRGKMSAQEVVSLLAREPMLVKRPFLLGDATGAVGFRESSWQALLQ